MVYEAYEKPYQTVIRPNRQSDVPPPCDDEIMRLSYGMFKRKVLTL